MNDIDGMDRVMYGKYNNSSVDRWTECTIQTTTRLLVKDSEWEEWEGLNYQPIKLCASIKQKKTIHIQNLSHHIEQSPVAHSLRYKEVIITKDKTQLKKRKLLEFSMNIIWVARQVFISTNNAH